MIRARAALLSLLVLAAFSCSSKPPSSGSRSVAVTLKDFSLQLGTNNGSAGTVTFNIVNRGPSVHEFLIFRTNLSEDALPIKSARVDEAAPDLELIHKLIDIANAERKHLSIELGAGKYVMICNIPGHYKAGMHATFTVT